MNKIIFQRGRFKVKVRDLIIVILLLLLFAWMFKGCVKEKTEEEKIKEIVKESCNFPKHNINDLDALLSRGDLCSEIWFEDLEDFSERLRKEVKELKKMSSAKDKALYKTQSDLITVLEAFKKHQGEKEVNALEKSFDAYRKEAGRGCK